MKEFIRGLFEVLVNSYWGALLILICGIVLIWYTIKNPQNSNTWYIDLKAYLGGIAAIVCGVLIIIFKLLGKM